jgi:hypothetical protein
LSIASPRGRLISRRRRLISWGRLIHRRAWRHHRAPIPLRGQGGIVKDRAQAAAHSVRRAATCRSIVPTMSVVVGSPHLGWLWEMGLNTCSRCLKFSPFVVVLRRMGVARSFPLQS